MWKNVVVERNCVFTLRKYLPQLLVSLAALDVPASETLSICGVGCFGVWKDLA